MRDIILNETKYAQKCLETGYIEQKPFYTLIVLAKYYHYKCGYKRAQIRQALIDFMAANYSRYKINEAQWNETIAKVSNKASHFNYYEIDGVPITESELATIKTIKNKTLERLAFTLLCLAKLSHIKNPENEGWVNIPAKDIFALARVTGGECSRDEKINRLLRMGLVDLPRNNTNLSIRVKFMDDDSEVKLVISDFRELGYEYLLLNGEKLIRCAECGILMKDCRARTKKYCKECAAYVPINQISCKCVDCGKIFLRNARTVNKVRCDSCQEIYRKKYKAVKELERYYNNKIK